MGKKLSHIETFHRKTSYRHRGSGHSLRQEDLHPFEISVVGSGKLIRCVCGETSIVTDKQLIDDPGACATCGNALKRFEMFTTSYERCYRCEPVVTSAASEPPKERKIYGFDDGWALLPQVNNGNRWVYRDFSIIRVVSTESGQENKYPLIRLATPVGHDWVAYLQSGEFNYSKNSSFHEMIEVLDKLWEESLQF